MPVYDTQDSAWQQQLQHQNNQLFLRSLLAGIVVAALCSVVYAAFTIVTHIVLGLAGIVVGALVGGAVVHAANQGTGAFKGRRYQIAAAVLTYLSICSAATLQLLWGLHSAGRDIFHLSQRAYLFFLMLSVASPFYRLTRSWSGLIDLLILFLSIRAAWRVAGGNAKLRKREAGGKKTTG